MLGDDAYLHKYRMGQNDQESCSDFDNNILIVDRRSAESKSDKTPSGTSQF